MNSAATIMVVEDEGVVAKDLETSLRRLGYDVSLTVSSGEAAVDMVESVRPDLVLMDVRLRGGMDGVEAARLIQFRHDLPVVYLTAYADGATLRRSLDTQPYGYLVKPFEDKELHATIETALHKNRLEKLLKKSEEHYRTFSEAIPQMVWTAHKDGLIQYVNQRWLDYTGLSLAESQGDGWQRAVHPYDLSDLLEGWREAVETVTDFETECRLKRSMDHRFRWHLMRAQALQDSKGALKWFGTFTDIQIEKENREALRRSEAHKRALMDASPDAIITLDQEGRVLEVNSTVEQVFGWSRAKVVGKALANTLFPPESAAVQRQQFSELLGVFDEQTPTRRAELTLLRADGSRATVEISIAQIQDESPLMYAAYLRDLTERRAAEAKHDRLRHELNLANSDTSFLLMCASCKQVMDPSGRWHPVETFPKDRSHANISHGVCPDCAAKLYPKPPAL